MNINENDLDDLKSKLQDHMIGRGTVLKVELVFNKKNFLSYVPAHKIHRFVKVSATLPKHVTYLKNLIEKGFRFNGDSFMLSVYETAVPFPLRYMIDTCQTGIAWYRFPAKTYSLRPKSEMLSSCQVEIDILDYSTIRCANKCVGDNAKNNPQLRTLSFDIE